MSNAYERGLRKAIPAVLVYVRHGEHVLMLHRNAPGADYHSGRWNGLGGKLEADEAPAETAVREAREEAGLALEPERLKPLGVLQFPNFKAHRSEDWIVWVFVARLDAALPRPEPRRGPEGDLHWVAAAEVFALRLWPGDRQFLPHVLAERPFQGTIWYDGAEVLRAEVAALST